VDELPKLEPKPLAEGATEERVGGIKVQIAPIPGRLGSYDIWLDASYLGFVYPVNKQGERMWKSSAEIRYYFSRHQAITELMMLREEGLI
jgi:hypothetical protein